MSIKENFLYYIVELWSNSWLYNKVFSRITPLCMEIDRCENASEAYQVINFKWYKYIPLSYKRKLVHEKFN